MELGHFHNTVILQLPALQTRLTTIMCAVFEILFIYSSVHFSSIRYMTQQQLQCCGGLHNSVVTNIRIRIRIFSSKSRIFRFGFMIIARRIIFEFRFVIESSPNLNLFNIFNLRNLAMKYKLCKI